MPSAYDTIRDAIVNRRPLTCWYADKRREVCPHVLGRKNGRAQVLAFQFAGDSVSGLPPAGDWRCMPVDALTGVEISEGPWRTNPAAVRPQTCVDEVDVEVGR